MPDNSQTWQQDQEDQDSGQTGKKGGQTSSEDVDKGTNMPEEDKSDEDQIGGM